MIYKLSAVKIVLEIKLKVQNYTRDIIFVSDIIKNNNQNLHPIFQTLFNVIIITSAL